MIERERKAEERDSLKDRERGGGTKIYQRRIM